MKETFILRMTIEEAISWVGDQNAMTEIIGIDYPGDGTAVITYVIWS